MSIEIAIYKDDKSVETGQRQVNLQTIKRGEVCHRWIGNVQVAAFCSVDDVFGSLLIKGKTRKTRVTRYDKNGEEFVPLKKNKIVLSRFSEEEEIEVTSGEFTLVARRDPDENTEYDYEPEALHPTNRNY